MVILGGPIFEKVDSPESWAAAVKSAGYRAAYCPLTPDADDSTVAAYAAAAQKAGIVIAEVGAWSNPLSADPVTRADALEKCKNGLELAERIGARCCVNIAGSRGQKWDGPDPRDLTDETFEMIVQSVRQIIDAVKPTRTCYTLEPMPWMYPDSAESYLRLIQAIDRRAFGVHFDPVNLVCSPQRYFNNGDLICDFVESLGPFIRSCHAKDILLQPNLTTHLDEVRPGLGSLDYYTYLSALNNLSEDIPLMLEHLQEAEEYRLSAEYIRSVAAEARISL